ncbi:hypothetical protein B0H13DRAFT_2339932 [Mycena leptocephala]|nr:hypothetical protein B0H13DRAFT_2339932 [Mycena leptocephala]
MCLCRLHSCRCHSFLSTARLVCFSSFRIPFIALFCLPHNFRVGLVPERRLVLAALSSLPTALHVRPAYRFNSESAKLCRSTPQDSASSRAFREPSSLVIVLLPRPSLSPLVSSYPLQAPPFTHQLSCALSEYRCCHLKSSAALASFFRRLSVTHDTLYPKASGGSSGPVILFPARPPYPPSSHFGLFGVWPPLALLEDVLVCRLSYSIVVMPVCCHLNAASRTRLLPLAFSAPQQSGPAPKQKKKWPGWAVIDSNGKEARSSASTNDGDISGHSDTVDHTAPLNAPSGGISTTRAKQRSALDDNLVAIDQAKEETTAKLQELQDQVLNQGTCTEHCLEASLRALCAFGTTESQFATLIRSMATYTAARGTLPRPEISLRSQPGSGVITPPKDLRPYSHLLRTLPIFGGKDKRAREDDTDNRKAAKKIREEIVLQPGMNLPVSFHSLLFDLCALDIYMPLSLFTSPNLDLITCSSATLTTRILNTPGPGQKQPLVPDTEAFEQKYLREADLNPIQ